MAMMTAISEMTVAEQFEAREYARKNGDWFPANGGTETPFTSRSGIRMLYVWQPSTGNHAYLNLSNDMLMTQEEAEMAMQLY